MIHFDDLPPASCKFLIDACLSSELSSNARERGKSANIFRGKERRVTNAFEKQLQAVIIEYDSAPCTSEIRRRNSPTPFLEPRTSWTSLRFRIHSSVYPAIERIMPVVALPTSDKSNRMRKRPVHEWTDAANMIRYSEGVAFQISTLQMTTYRSFEEILHGGLISDGFSITIEIHVPHPRLGRPGLQRCRSCCLGVAAPWRFTSKNYANKHGVTTISVGQHTKKADVLHTECGTRAKNRGVHET